MAVIARSYLFVPGDRPDRFAKAAATGAHEIILDLEDAVAPSAKPAARDHVAQWFAGGGAGLVRINGLDTPFASDDLAMLTRCPSASVMVPKANAGALDEVARALPDRPLIALIETVEGLLAIHAVAASAGVTRLAFGNLDFSADARIPDAAEALDPARFDIVIASRAAGLAAPIDGVTTEIADEARLAADIARAVRLGFGGKLCIHPRQVGPVAEGFAPRPDEVRWAHRVVAAVEEGAGVVQVDGKMVDAPVILRARAILEASGGGAEG